MEKAASTPSNPSPARHRFVWLAEGVLALALAYVLAARALDTGSWQQYFLAFVLLIFGIRGFVRTFRRGKS